MAYKKKEITIKLTDEAKKFIDENWDKLKFPDLVKGTFNNPALDGRCIESKLVTEYLGNREPIPCTYIKIGGCELDDHAKRYIEENALKEKSFTKLARIIFNNNSLGPLSRESKAVAEYLKSLPPEISGRDITDEISDEYKITNTIKQVVEKVNKAIISSYDDETLNSNQRKHMEVIKKFLRSPRFLQMINSYTSKVSRDIFEAEYIRTIFDKPDLTPDELNLCINLCWNYVHQITINKHKALLDEKYELSMSDPESKTSTALADMIAAKTKELNDCDVRQQKLISDLQGKRSERHKNKQKANLSVADLVEWWKDDKERKKALEREEMRKMEVAQELDRLENFDEVRSRILGYSRDELLHG